jgi:hypothetical protein
MPQIIIKDINLGGLSESIYQGAANSVAAAVGLDLNSEPGLIKVNQKLTRESSIYIDDLVKCILPCSDGNTYIFGSTNGKIWKRTSAGVYSLEATAAPAAGAVGILEAYEYQGYIYYAMQSRLGRVAVGAPTDWSGRNDSWATFTNTDADFHPMKEVNQVLYIGDKNYVAQVDAGVFSADALDIKTPLRIKSLGKLSTDLLVGTFVNVYRVLTEIFRWNTWSTDSYQASDEIPEVGINSFLQGDNSVLASCGRKGNIYYYNGSVLEQYRQIPGDWLGSKEATIHPNASVNKNGVPMFCLSNVSGNPAKQGLYSFLGLRILNLENLISTGRYSNQDIGAAELVGTDLFLAWKEQSTITMTIANPCVVTFTAHGLSNGDPISFATTGALPTGIVAGTIYYARSVTADTLNLYDTAAHAIAGGATGRVTTTGTQSGTHTSTIYGIDILDTTAKVASAYFETRVITVERDKQETISGFVGYRSLPTGTSIKIWYKNNHATDYLEATTVVDTDRKIVFTKESFPPANTYQFKIELVASGNDAPEVESTQFDL